MPAHDQADALIALALDVEVDDCETCAKMRAGLEAALLTAQNLTAQNIELRDQLDGIQSGTHRHVHDGLVRHFSDPDIGRRRRS